MADDSDVFEPLCQGGEDENSNEFQNRSVNNGSSKRPKVDSDQVDEIEQPAQPHEEDDDDVCSSHSLI